MLDPQNAKLVGSFFLMRRIGVENGTLILIQSDSSGGALGMLEYQKSQQRSKTVSPSL